MVGKAKANGKIVRAGDKANFKIDKAAAVGKKSSVSKENAHTTSNKLRGPTIITSDETDRKRAVESASDTDVRTHFAGRSDCESEGSPSTINDGEPVNVPIYLLTYALKIHCAITYLLSLKE